MIKMMEESQEDSQVDNEDAEIAEYTLDDSERADLEKVKSIIFNFNFLIFFVFRLKVIMKKIWLMNRILTITSTQKVTKTMKKMSLKMIKIILTMMIMVIPTLRMQNQTYDQNTQNEQKNEENQTGDVESSIENQRTAPAKAVSYIEHFPLLCHS